MQRDEVLAVLAKHEGEIKSHGVKSLALFGPVARNEAAPEDEVDLLVEFDQPTGMLGFVGLQIYLEELLGKSVHLVTPGGIRQGELRDQILREAIRAA